MYKEGYFQKQNNYGSLPRLIESALVADKVGADRIELCKNLMAVKMVVI